MIQGDKTKFDNQWKLREESNKTYWTNQEPKNQLEFAFRNHWLTFVELMDNPLFNQGKNVLEVGCGRGTMSCYFSEAGYKCTLLDYSHEVLNKAKKIFMANQLKAEFVQGDALELPFDNESFDVVFSIGLFEHFEDVERIAFEQIRVLREGGLFIAYVVPNEYGGIQRNFHWINHIIKVYSELGNDNPSYDEKEPLFRNAFKAQYYKDLLHAMPLKGIQSSGIYSVPMISHSTMFPFTLMPEKAEKAYVDYLNKEFQERRHEGIHNPWLCSEEMGQAFLVYGYKVKE